MDLIRAEKPGSMIWRPAYKMKNGRKGGRLGKATSQGHTAQMGGVVFLFFEEEKQKKWAQRQIDL